ncbi:hypothetical protein, partial [Bradyrhizobium sp. OHSU_III]|uniref:hypothetical protein n=1 Tax=Bradyrhizobium sp. OHSU_III TaxID=1297865 RepID=UPI001FCC11E0
AYRYAHAGYSKRASSSAARCDLPDVCPGISNHRPPVTVGRIRRILDRFGACRNRALIGFVRVRNVDIEKARHCFPYGSAVADQKHRVPDPDFGWRAGANLAFRTEDASQEFGQAGGIAGD